LLIVLQNHRAIRLIQIRPMISCHKRIQHVHEIPWIAALRSQRRGGGLPAVEQ
jgi:hypothetical protein